LGFLVEVTIVESEWGRLERHWQRDAGVWPKPDKDSTPLPGHAAMSLCEAPITASGSPVA
jgi:hypothetical protein